MRCAIAVGRKPGATAKCLVVEFNGESWATQNFPDVTGTLYGVYAYSPEDIWVCGYTGSAPILYHYDVDEWLDYSSEISAIHPTVSLKEIRGTSSDNIYMAGNNGVVYQWDGSSWANVYDYTACNNINICVNSTNGACYLTGYYTSGGFPSRYVYSDVSGSWAIISTSYSSSWGFNRLIEVEDGHMLCYYSESMWIYSKIKEIDVDGSSIREWTPSGGIGSIYSWLCQGLYKSSSDFWYYQAGGYDSVGHCVSRTAENFSGDDNPWIGQINYISQAETDDVWVCGDYDAIWGAAVLSHYDGTSWSNPGDYNSDSVDAYSLNDIKALDIEYIPRSTENDLVSATGTYRNVFLKIHGQEPILWRRSSRGEPAGWSRSIKTCLEVKSEMGMGLNLVEASLDASVLSFELDDMLDTDGSYYFGKLFAPARWASNAHARVSADILPGASTIYLQSAETLPENGTAYINDETITYTSKVDTGVENQNWITGVARDVYPCMDGISLGRYYECPPSTTGGYRMVVSTVPFTMVGKKVALYIITWNEQYNEWNTEDDAQCIWMGRISDRIQYDGTRGKWILSCESLMKDLDRKIAAQSRKTTLAARVNLTTRHESARKIRVKEISVETDVPTDYLTRYQDIIISDQSYSAANLIAEMSAQMYNADVGRWDYTEGTYGGLNYGLKIAFGWNDDCTKLAIKATSKNKCKCRIEFSDDNHLMQALGFNVKGGVQSITIDLQTYSSDKKLYYETYIGEGEIYRCYQPMRQDYNGGRLFAASTYRLIADQGDSDDGENGVIRIKDYKTTSGVKRTAYYRFDDLNAQEDTLFYPAPYISLSSDYSLLFTGNLDFIGSTSSDESPEIEQVFAPWAQNSDLSYRGPFEILLRILLSTGSPGVNHETYDCYKHPDFCLGMPAALVDIDSFLAADKIVNVGNGLANRSLYPIENKSFLDLLRAECKLFGFSVIWRNGQFAIVETMPPPVDTYQATINKDVIGKPKWVPRVDYSTEIVVNQYECQVNFNYLSNKFDPPTTITDMDSVACLAQTRSISIEHKGIFRYPTVSVSVETLTEKLLGRFIRFPMPVFDVPLMPTLINTIFVGDVVIVDLDNIHDPFGGGTKDLVAYGVILNLSWNFESWLGNARILLFALCDAFGPPYSGSAAVDIDATNGGWDAASCRLTLLPHEFGESDTDDEDGERFEAGHFIRIIERGPIDPENPQYWGPIEVDKNYAADGNYLLTLVYGTTLTGWDATKEYVVVFADYDDVVTAQQSASYIGDESGYTTGTETISRWG